LETLITDGILFHICASTLDGEALSRPTRLLQPYHSLISDNLIFDNLIFDTYWLLTSCLVQSFR